MCERHVRQRERQRRCTVWLVFALQVAACIEHGGHGGRCTLAALGGYVTAVACVVCLASGAAVPYSSHGIGCKARGPDLGRLAALAHAFVLAASRYRRLHHALSR